MLTNGANEFFELMTSHFSEITYETLIRTFQNCAISRYVYLYTCVHAKCEGEFLNRALFWFQNEWILRWIMSDRAVVARCMDKRTITCQNCTQNTCTLSFPNFFLLEVISINWILQVIFCFSSLNEDNHISVRNRLLAEGGDQKQKLLFLMLVYVSMHS